VRIAFFALLLALFFPGTLHGEPQIDVTVVVQNPLDRREHGSGVIVGRNQAGDILVLTARHVAVVRPLEVMFQDGGIVPVVARYVQPTSARHWVGDVAVVAIPNVPRVSFATLSPADAPAGASLRVIGNPIDRRFYTSQARASSSIRVRWIDEVSDLFVDDPSFRNVGHAFNSMTMNCRTCAPGDSGAGVFDASGDLVGIVFGRSYETSRAFAVPISEIRPLLSELR